ncbi:hypothetical protein PSI22_02635 [Xenorhabdus sp. XENO-7]|uniref:Uncharacterized protein n=1 Tax=Xenorhabdus aichiensis TaxID=3025874 RepID=A0ABT5LYQ3_9GAMM|nr:hypothetical protein [Xenorhabdus aichiensis]MDC9620555.1 hypothetical protein [Xenorhabdus aichiensis]
MYYTLGYQSIIESINKAITPYYNYNNFIKKHSIFTHIPKQKNPLITTYEGALPFCYYHLISLEKHFTKNPEKINKMINSNIFYEWLNRLEINNEIHNLVNRIIKIVIVNELYSYTNGTTENTIGLSSIDFKDNFNHQDFLELIFHQLTHMILFIDDISHTHMKKNDKLITVDVEGVKSIFDDKKFPIYTLFHSYIVGVEILIFRKEFFGEESSSIYHGKTDRIIKICQKMSISIENNISYFSNRSIYIFEKSKELINKFTDKEIIK